MILLAQRRIGLKRYLIILGLAVTGAANAADLLIDDFSTGPYSVTLTAPLSSNTAFQAAAVPGATRTTRLFVEANPLNRQISLDIGPGGLAIVDSGTEADNWFRVGYGYENNGSGVPIVDPLNQNLSAYNSFKIHFRSNDLDNQVKVSVVTMVGTTQNVSQSTLIAPGGNSTNPFDFFVPFSSFTGTANFADADILVFEFDNTPSGDFAIDSISAVPEPATMLALGTGAAALIARRRRKS